MTLTRTGHDMRRCSALHDSHTALCSFPSASSRAEESRVSYCTFTRGPRTCRFRPSELWTECACPRRQSWTRELASFVECGEVARLCGRVSGMWIWMGIWDLGFGEGGRGGLASGARLRVKGDYDGCRERRVRTYRLGMGYREVVEDMREVTYLRMQHGRVHV